MQRNYIEALLNTRDLEEAALDAAQVDVISGRVRSVCHGGMQGQGRSLCEAIASTFRGILDERSRAVGGVYELSEGERGEECGNEAEV